MKRLSTLVAAPLAALAIAAPAYADNPHFLSVTGQLSGVNLIVSFKEAGLGNTTTVDYAATATASATYVCVNRGGKNPSAQNKTFVTGQVSSTGSFTSGKNGQITASLAIAPPGPGSFSCPPGQSLEIAEVTYTSVTLTDTTNNVSVPFNQTFSTGCLLPNVKGAC